MKQSMNAREPMDMENCNAVEKFCGVEGSVSRKDNGDDILVATWQRRSKLAAWFHADTIGFATWTELRGLNG